MASTVITILHFNDVYNLEPRTKEPVGGAARFVTAFDSYSHLDPLVIFSGDALNPSPMSSITKGKHFIPLFNRLNIRCAVYGNHDFDHGVDNLISVAGEMNFPWLLSNVYDIMTGLPLADAESKVIIEWKGKKLGFIGLVEKEWLDAVSTLDLADIEYVDFIEQGILLAKSLREDDEVDYVIALTHMRWDHDVKLAKGVEGIDLILGGHDHDYGCKHVNNKYVVKSGTDFQHYSLVTLTFGSHNKVKVKVEEKKVTASIPESEDALKLLQEFQAIFDESMSEVIGQVNADLDGRFNMIRSQETNLGNFIADIIGTGVRCDVVLINSGCMRSNTVHPAGPFKLGTMVTILPMRDTVVVLEMTGEQILTALENGVSRYPNLEGRFPQVSGICFEFDPVKSSGSRITLSSVFIQGDPIELKKKYRVATSTFLASGKDGYKVLKKCTEIISPEESPALSTLITNFFESIEILKGNLTAKCPHWQGIMTPQEKERFFSQLEASSPASNVHANPPAVTKTNVVPRWHEEDASCAHVRYKALVEAQKKLIDKVLQPTTEGRITMVSHLKMSKRTM